MSFPLIGNERIKDSMTAALAADRLPHALLLEGEAGLGKRTLALWLAKAALCCAAERPCGKCRSCELFAAGTHPDFVEISPESSKKSITVDRIRELRRQAFIKPHIAARRVFLLNTCGGMNEQSQNALLKILEEPPQGVVFIITASSRSTLLETVISRCVILTLSVPEHKPAAERIMQIISNEGEHTDFKTVSDALDLSAGNIGAALSLLKGTNDEAAQAAKKFVSLLPNGSRMEMLKILQPFSRDRISADKLLSALQIETAAAIKGSYRSTTVARSLNRFFCRLDDYSKLLKTNINLSLLFTAMVSCIEG